MDNQIIASIISAIATIAAGLFVYLLSNKYYKHSQKIENDKMMKELFSNFNSRYVKYNDSLNEITSKYISIKEFDDDLKKDPTLKNNLIDYFNLCAEEYFWYKKRKN